ncbi:hypothetical protein BKA63DRAFT_593079 [Paraphoma chrysanthemicola]|nr:hypothetical protein BKA63DRAFT_593079 [Paraphoma chrysanthemicola]
MSAVASFGMCSFFESLLHLAAVANTSTFYDEHRMIQYAQYVEAHSRFTSTFQHGPPVYILAILRTNVLPLFPSTTHIPSLRPTIMAKRKASFSVLPDKHLDSGFFSDAAQPTASKHINQSYILPSAPPAPKKRLVQMSIKTELPRAQKEQVHGNFQPAPRTPLTPLTESSRINISNGPNNSPLTSQGRRADHDIIVHIIRMAHIQGAFLRDYNSLRHLSDNKVPRRQDLGMLLKKYPVLLREPLIFTLLKDLAQLDENCDIVKEANVEMWDELASMKEDNDTMEARIDELMVETGELAPYSPGSEEFVLP